MLAVNGTIGTFKRDEPPRLLLLALDPLGDFFRAESCRPLLLARLLDPLGDLDIDFADGGRGAARGVGTALDFVECAELRETAVLVLREDFSKKLAAKSAGLLTDKQFSIQSVETVWLRRRLCTKWQETI